MLQDSSISTSSLSYRVFIHRVAQQVRIVRSSHTLADHAITASVMHMSLCNIITPRPFVSCTQPRTKRVTVKTIVGIIRVRERTGQPARYLYCSMIERTTLPVHQEDNFNYWENDGRNATPVRHYIYYPSYEIACEHRHAHNHPYHTPLHTPTDNCW